MNVERLRTVAACAVAGPPDLSRNLEALRLATDADLAAAKAECEQAQAEAAWSRRAMREGKQAHSYGHRSGASNCLSCGAFKPEPSATCGRCGDDPVTYNGSRHDFNRAYGYAS